MRGRALGQLELLDGPGGLGGGGLCVRGSALGRGNSSTVHAQWIPGHTRGKPTTLPFWDTLSLGSSDPHRLTAGPPHTHTATSFHAGQPACVTPLGLAHQVECPLQSRCSLLESLEGRVQTSVLTSLPLVSTGSAAWLFQAVPSRVSTTGSMMTHIAHPGVG